MKKVQLYIVLLMMFNCVNLHNSKQNLIFSQASVLSYVAEFHPIKCYLLSVEVNVISKVADFSSTVYVFLSAQLYSTFFKSHGEKMYFIQILRKNYGLSLLFKLSNRKSLSCDLKPSGKFNFSCNIRI